MNDRSFMISEGRAIVLLSVLAVRAGVAERFHQHLYERTGKGLAHLNRRQLFDRRSIRGQHRREQIGIWNYAK